ncbi:MAG: hypothetical protein HLUCCO16_11675 [Phormidium sp. OSCR]|nr:MAG: hypothetical protein HLUCCO16_11675 [Phormidium sp. OSCR]
MVSQAGQFPETRQQQKRPPQKALSSHTESAYHSPFLVTWLCQVMPNGRASRLQAAEPLRVRVTA